MGWYIADSKVIYQVFNGDNVKDEQQKVDIQTYQEHTFIIPFNANYFKGRGARLLINAVGGSLVLDYTLDNDPLCFHIWGL